MIRFLDHPRRARVESRSNCRRNRRQPDMYLSATQLTWNPNRQMTINPIEPLVRNMAPKLEGRQDHNGNKGDENFTMQGNGSIKVGGDFDQAGSRKSRDA